MTRVDVYGSVAYHVVCARRPTADIAFGEVVCGPGGSGGAVAAQLGCLGVDTHLVSSVGDDDIGRQVLAGLRATGVDCIDVACEGRTTQVVAVVEDDVELTCWPGSTTPPAVTSQPDGLTWVSGFPEMLPTLATLSARGCRPVVDLGYAPFSRDAAQLQQYCRPIAHQIGTAVLSARHLRPDGLRSVVDDLLVAGCQTVLATRAEAGVDVWSGNGHRHLDAYSVELVDPLCAGDAFIAGFLAARNRGSSELEAATFGQAVAACKVSRFGRFPSSADVEAWMDRDRLP